MSEPVDEGPGTEEPKTVRVHRSFNLFGAADDLIEVAEESAGQWDARQWHARPPM